MKILLLTTSAILSIGVINNRSHHSSVAMQPKVLTGYMSASSNIINDPTLESILFNPSIAKKQLPGNMVQAIAHHKENKAHFVIHFRNKQLHGEWETFYNNGIACDSGRFEKNLPDGEWKTWYPDGKLKAVRHYSAQKYLYVQDDLSRNHPKVQKFAITRLAQQKNNIAGHFNPQFENNVGSFASLPILERIQYNTSSETDGYIPPFQNCLHHGVFVNYYEDGKVRDSGNYVNGLKHGIWKEAQLYNLVAVGFYHEGIKTGQWKFYDKSGMLKYTARYNRNGKQLSTHYFNQ